MVVDLGRDLDIGIPPGEIADETGSVSAVVGTETLLWQRVESRLFWVGNIWINLENLVAGDLIYFRVYIDWDGAGITRAGNSPDGSSNEIITKDNVWNFTGVQLQKWIAIPVNSNISNEIEVTMLQTNGSTRSIIYKIATGIVGG